MLILVSIIAESKSSEKKSSESLSNPMKRSTSSPNKVPGLFKSSNSPKNNKKEKPEGCDGMPSKTTFITGLEKKLVDDIRKGSLDVNDARKALNKVKSFRPPVRDNESNCFSAADEPDSNVDPNLRNVDRNLIEKIENEIITHLDPIQWEDVAGLEYAKKTIHEIAILPLRRPHLFTGLRRPPKGLIKLCFH